MKKKIFEAVQQSKAELLTFTTYQEFSIWNISHIGIGKPNDIIYYHEALASIGIDINDFPMETSFTLFEFLGTLNKMKDKGQI